MEKNQDFFRKERIYYELRRLIFVRRIDCYGKSNSCRIGYSMIHNNLHGDKNDGKTDILPTSIHTSNKNHGHFIVTWRASPSVKNKKIFFTDSYMLYIVMKEPTP